MILKERVEFICSTLCKLYPQSHCSLTYDEPYQLLIAARLSAQCTDERVNKVTPALFARYTTIEDFASADFNELAFLIRSCGFYNSKAKSIIEMAKQLAALGGVLPDSIDELVKLSGVGRKTANLICGDIYNKPAIIADTHCIRLSNRLGLINNNTNPIAVEKRLKDIVPPDHQTKLCHNFVYHGRAICNARSPKCNECELRSVCTFYKKSAQQR